MNKKEAFMKIGEQLEKINKNIFPKISTELSQERVCLILDVMEKRYPATVLANVLNALKKDRPSRTYRGGMVVKLLDGSTVYGAYAYLNEDYLVLDLGEEPVSIIGRISDSQVIKSQMDRILRIPVETVVKVFEHGIVYL